MALKSVCVFAGSNHGSREEYGDAARGLGRALAARGIELIYGGGRVGLMGRLADGALEAGGRVIGVIPQKLMAKEVGHRNLTELRVVASMHERKAMMADLAEGFIALPGGWGTLDELFEILTWAQLGIHRKPCGMLNVLGYFDKLRAFLAHTTDEGFVRAEQQAIIRIGTTPDELLDDMLGYVPPVVEKWIARAEV